MALDQSALLEVLEALKAAEVDDRIRQAAEMIYQALIEAELTAVIGAHPHQRTETRAGLRNGHRARTITTTAGDLELKIPRLRAGSFFPSLLERLRSGCPAPPRSKPSKLVMRVLFPSPALLSSTSATIFEHLLG